MQLLLLGCVTTRQTLVQSKQKSLYKLQSLQNVKVLFYFATENYQKNLLNSLIGHHLTVLIEDEGKIREHDEHGTESSKFITQVHL